MQNQENINSQVPQPDGSEENNKKLPYADLKNYNNPIQRQVDLDTAEQVNISKAADSLGITAEQWVAMRKKLGRTPEKNDL